MSKDATIRRPDAWEARLPDETARWKAYERLQRGSWIEVQSWIVQEFGIAPPGKSGLYTWKRHMAGLASAHRIEEALSNRENLRREMEQIGDMDPELQHAWLQLAMESSLRGDPKAGERYLKMARSLRADATKRTELQLKQQAETRAGSELEIMRRKLELQEEKIADARAVLEKAGGAAVDPKALAEEIDRILGRKA